MRQTASLLGRRVVDLLARVNRRLLPRLSRSKQLVIVVGVFACAAHDRPVLHIKKRRIHPAFVPGNL